MDRWIVALQAVLEFHVLGAQADRAGQSRLDENVGVLRAKTGDVSEGGHRATIASAAGAGNPSSATTPRVGGHRSSRAAGSEAVRDYDAALSGSGYASAAKASTREIGRLPQRARVAKSSSRST